LQRLALELPQLSREELKQHEQVRCTLHTTCWDGPSVAAAAARVLLLPLLLPTD